MGSICPSSIAGQLNRVAVKPAVYGVSDFGRLSPFSTVAARDADSIYLAFLANDRTAIIVPVGPAGET